MGVSTLHTSNIKGKMFQFAHASCPGSCVDWAWMSHRVVIVVTVTDRVHPPKINCSTGCPCPPPVSCIACTLCLICLFTGVGFWIAEHYSKHKLKLEYEGTQDVGSAYSSKPKNLFDALEKADVSKISTIVAANQLCDICEFAVLNSANEKFIPILCTTGSLWFCLQTDRKFVVKCCAGHSTKYSQEEDYHKKGWCFVSRCFWVGDIFFNSNVSHKSKICHLLQPGSSNIAETTAKRESLQSAELYISEVCIKVAQWSFKVALVHATTHVLTVQLSCEYKTSGRPPNVCVLSPNTKSSSDRNWIKTVFRIRETAEICLLTHRWIMSVLCRSKRRWVWNHTRRFQKPWATTKRLETSLTWWQFWQIFLLTTLTSIICSEVSSLRGIGGDSPESLTPSVWFHFHIFTIQRICLFLSEFYRFVRSHHKLEFDTMCINITGQGCGYKPSDTVSKKRTSTDGAAAQSSGQWKVIHIVAFEMFEIVLWRLHNQQPVFAVPKIHNEIIRDNEVKFLEHV